MKLHTLNNMTDKLTWISARRLRTDFLEWAEKKGESFSYALFNRAKVSADDDLTDRQKLLCELAEQFVEIEAEKRQPEYIAQMSEA